ncbi:MAG: pyridoxamine 5'-phosphate oxidase [Actinobacteria bacterium]|nr:pyridoxamine 5'-phosphate oxidase [Actinomycetota bacterium]
MWWDRSMTDSPLADMRVHYDLGRLADSDLAGTPLAQFGRWFADAQAGGVIEPNAMVLATAEGNVPSARTVLLKDVDRDGFTFFTNLLSRKSRELHANPHASLVFPWYALHRQVVVIGEVTEVSRDEAADYFALRPRGSQLGAWASQQSQPVARDQLDAAYEEAEARFPAEVPIPEFWGGWRIRPTSIEFWQGRESRLHDRLQFVGSGAMEDPARWRVIRLSP